MILPILTVPKDVVFLHQKSLEIPVAALTSQDMQQFFDNLLETAVAARTPEGWRAAGLSAVQVGKLIRCYAIRMNRNDDSFTLFVNPKLELLGQAQDTALESCLSVPGKTGQVLRNKRIRLTYQTRSGEEKREQYDGFLARIIQHEQDHLEGRLYTER